MYTNYYLDLTKVFKLEKNEQNKIHEYYREMISSCDDNRDNMSKSYFNTLYYNEYLKEIRDEKIDKILS